MFLGDFMTANEKEKNATIFTDSDAFNSNLAKKKLRKKNPILHGNDEVKALIPPKKKKANESQRKFNVERMFSIILIETVY